jgi:hypothetical protein
VHMSTTLSTVFPRTASRGRSLVKFSFAAVRAATRERFYLQDAPCTRRVVAMTPNQKRLARLQKERPETLATIPDSTLRSHIGGRRPRHLEHLVLYEALGMPLRGWFSIKELRDLGVFAAIAEKEGA